MPGLVLSRKADEKIIIGDGSDKIEILVVNMKNGIVRLRIDAPGHIPVHREEVYDAIQREKSQGDAKGLAGAGVTQSELKHQENQLSQQKEG